MKHEEVVKTLREIHKKIKAPKGYKKSICTNPYGPPHITIYEAEGEVLPAVDDAGELQESICYRIAVTIKIVRANVILHAWTIEKKTVIAANNPNLNAKIKEVIVSACKNV